LDWSGCLLANYKHLHELFQQLEDRYYLIYHDAKRLPADQWAWTGLARNEPDLQLIVDDLLDLAGQASMAASTAMWKQKLTRARKELQTAIENGDTEQLKHAITHLKDVLGREPSRINTHLVSTASAMRLSALVKALTTVCDNLAQLNLDQGAVHQSEAFETGVEALARLDNNLTALIDNHNTFQELDDELRRVEILLDQDVSELEYAWQDLKPMMQKLCNGSQVGWAMKLSMIGAELESSLPMRSPSKVIRLFRSYRSQAIRSFNQVDRDLVMLCAELQKVGEPLAIVLRMIE
jgi:hypothetical protein